MNLTRLLMKISSLQKLEGSQCHFHGVSPTQFKSIFATELAKDAWDILQVEFEGTTVVRKSRIEFLISKFENL